MSGLRSILVATDFSENARHAAVRAGMLAELQPETRTAMQGAIAEHAAEVGRQCDIAFEARLEEGSVTKTIRDAAAQYELATSIRDVLVAPGTPR